MILFMLDNHTANLPIGREQFCIDLCGDVLARIQDKFFDFCE